MPATGVLRAGADVGGRARDRAGGRQAAEQRRDDVGDALRRSARRSGCAGRRSCGRRPPPTCSDSIAPSIATVSAGREQRRHQVGPELRNVQMRASPLGMPPKRVPIVSTGRPSTTTAAVPSEQRDDRAGNARREMLRHRRTMTTSADGQRRRGERERVQVRRQRRAGARGTRPARWRSAGRRNP